jgi:hypothetical protein
MRKSVTGVVVCNKSVFLVELSLSSQLGLETDSCCRTAAYLVRQGVKDPLKLLKPIGSCSI